VAHRILHVCLIMHLYRNPIDYRGPTSTCNCYDAMTELFFYSFIESPSRDESGVNALKQ
jgi:hypothetical protein